MVKRAAGGAHQEGKHIGKQRRFLSHKQSRHRVAEHASQDAGAEDFAEIGGGQPAGALVEQAAQERAHHAAGEGQQASGAQQVADKGSTERHGDAVAGPQEHAGDDVAQVLNGEALGGADGDGKGR